MDGGASLADPRVGTTLHGKYHLEKLLGTGGMAAVYRGSHRNGNRVAVKVLHAAIASHADLRERFLREGYVANKVDHRGAVRVLDDDTTDDGSVFLVMELLEGETLAAKWERAGRRLPPHEVADLALQLLDVLAAAHEKGIVHRDIKPENLFVTLEGTLKVLDFGIARLADAPGSPASSVTRTGNMLGTPAFMPPEQVLGRTRDIDGQTDVWAVGATMFSLLSGAYVHDAETVEEMVVYAGSRPARPIRSVAPETPPELAAVVDRALSFDKGRRWATARDMQSALEQSARALGARPTTEDRSAIHDAKPSTRSEVVAAAVPPAPARSGPSTIGGVEHRGLQTAPTRAHQWSRLSFIGVAVAVLAAFGWAMVVRRMGGSVGTADHAVMQTNTGTRASETAGTDTTIRLPPEPQPSVVPAEPTPVVPPAVRSANPANTANTNGVPAPRAAHAGAPTVRTTTSVASAVGNAESPPREKPNCNPPYTIDQLGRRIPKAECL